MYTLCRTECFITSVFMHTSCTNRIKYHTRTKHTHQCHKYGDGRLLVPAPRTLDMLIRLVLGWYVGTPPYISDTRHQHFTRQ